MSGDVDDFLRAVVPLQKIDHTRHVRRRVHGFLILSPADAHGNRQRDLEFSEHIVAIEQIEFRVIGRDQHREFGQSSLSESGDRCGERQRMVVVPQPLELPPQAIAARLNALTSCEELVVQESRQRAAWRRGEDAWQQQRRRPLGEQPPQVRQVRVLHVERTVCDGKTPRRGFRPLPGRMPRRCGNIAPPPERLAPAVSAEFSRPFRAVDSGTARHGTARRAGTARASAPRFLAAALWCWYIHYHSSVSDSGDRFYSLVRQPSC